MDNQFSEDRDSVETLVLTGNVPAFILKLWKLVEDPQFDFYISWNKGGSTFKVHDATAFAKEILPQFFKHNNFASFVRQLNMYGFRKVAAREQGGLKLDKDDWEFHHPNFLQGRNDLLQQVKRKNQPEHDKKGRNYEVIKLLDDVKNLHAQNENFMSGMNVLKRENEILWREMAEMREKHKRQEHVINKLIRFFISLVYGKSAGRGVKRRTGLAIESAGALVPSKRKPAQTFASPTNSSTFPSLEYIVDSPLPTDGLTDDTNPASSNVILRDDEPLFETEEVLDSSFNSNNAPEIDVLENVTPSTLVKGSLSEKTQDNQSSGRRKLKIPKKWNVSEDRSTLVTPTSTLIQSPWDSSIAKEYTTDDVVSRSARPSALIPTSPTSPQQTRFNFDGQMDRISNGIDYLQSVMNNESFPIDADTLNELFLPDDSSNDGVPSQVLLDSILPVRNVLDPLKTEETSQKDDASGKEATSQELVHYSRPFSPGQFLTDVFGSSEDQQAVEDRLSKGAI